MVVACGNAEGNHAASEPAANKAEDETEDPSECALLLNTMGHTSVTAVLARHGNGMVRPVVHWERAPGSSDDNHGLTWLLHHGLAGLLHHWLAWLLHHWLAGLLHHWLTWLLHHWLAGLLHHWLTWLHWHALRHWLLHWHDGLACCWIHGLALWQKILLLWVHLFLIHLLFLTFFYKNYYSIINTTI